MPGDVQELFGYGRVIRSQIALPGAVPAGLCPTPPAGPVIEVVLHAPRSLPPHAKRTHTIGEGGIDFTVPRLGAFACRPGQLAITPDPQADMARLRAVVVATMLPAVLWLGGGVVLHTAAVVLPGATGIVALAGPSGCGKSTLAAALVRDGAALVGDDTLRLGLNAESVAAHGLPGGQYRVAEGSSERYFDPLPENSIACGGSLAAVVVIERGAVTSPPQRLSAIAATQALLANRHRPQVPDLLGLSGAVLAVLGQTAARVPVYRWPRAEGDLHITAADMAHLGTLA